MKKKIDCIEKPSVHNIQGLVYTTKYKIPLACSIKIYSEVAIINTSYSDSQGVFELKIEKKYLNRNLLALVTPLKDYAQKDTSFQEIYQVIAECKEYNENKEFKTDTFSLKIIDSSQKIIWSVKSCVPNELGMTKD